MAQGTRAKQQEEQMGAIIAALQQQGERQERIALEQREQLQALAQQQTERHAQLAREFGDQLGNLAREHREVWEQLGQKQHRLEQRVTSLESEWRTTVEKTVSKLEGPWQEDLRKSVCADVKREVLEELHSSMESKPGTSPVSLRPEAAEFHPRETAAGGTVTGDGAEGAGAARPVQRPGSYDGRSSWSAYRRQFELLAQLNKWSETEKATFLAVSLKGPALAVLNTLPSTGLHDYPTLVSALETRFGTVHQTELHQACLRSRARRWEEGIPELAEDVERLTRLAYPDAPTSMIDSIAKDQFIDAFSDEDMRLRIRQSRPTTIREALAVALELESYQLASRQRL